MTESTSVRATFFDTKDSHEAALRGIFKGPPEDTDVYLDKICAPAFRLKTESLDLDLAAFKKQTAWVRANTQSVDLTVTQFLRDGTQRAGRHSSTTVMLDGTAGDAETFLFAEIADDGRLAWVRESVVRFGKKPAAPSS